MTSIVYDAPTTTESYGSNFAWVMRLPLMEKWSARASRSMKMPMRSIAWNLRSLRPNNVRELHQSIIDCSSACKRRCDLDPSPNPNPNQNLTLTLTLILINRRRDCSIISFLIGSLSFSLPPKYKNIHMKMRHLVKEWSDANDHFGPLIAGLLEEELRKELLTFTNRRDQRSRPRN